MKAPMEPRPPRIVDLVFAPEPAGRLRGLTLGTGMVVALYAGAFAAARWLGRSGGAELAAPAHDAVAQEWPIDVTPPPPTTPAPRAPVVAALPPARAAVRVATRGRPAPARPGPAAPAQAGRLAAAAAAPLDFTGSALIVGAGASYAGGATSGSGTSPVPATGAVASGATGGGGAAVASRARAVSLDQDAWNCPWPAEADARQVDQQTVILRVAVRPDGRAERVELLSDPGFGFGPAARLCALATRFEAARDAAGQAMAALSPPIRVHFFR
jgi:periplasmic protein TonB